MPGTQLRVQPGSHVPKLCKKRKYSRTSRIGTLYASIVIRLPTLIRLLHVADRRNSSLFFVDSRTTPIPGNTFSMSEDWG